MTKRCGYCRNVGHTKPNCEVMKYKIDMIKRFMPFERRNVLNLLAQNGYGDGAIVGAYSWRKGRDVSVMLTNDLINTFGTEPSRYIEYRQVKYCKRVRVTLKTFSGIPPEGYSEEKSDNELLLYFTPSIYVSGMNLEDPSETVECAVFYNSLDNVTSARAKTNHGFLWERPCQLLSPSYELKIEEVDTKTCHLHERLK